MDSLDKQYQLGTRLNADITLERTGAVYTQTIDQFNAGIYTYCVNRCIVDIGANRGLNSRERECMIACFQGYVNGKNMYYQRVLSSLP